MSNIALRLGKLIRHLRKEQNLSQEELAEKAQLHTNYVGLLERGQKNLTIATLEKVTLALGISLEHFFHHLDPVGIGEESSELIHLLNKLPKKHKSLVLHLVQSAVQWEEENKNMP